MRPPTLNTQRLKEYLISSGQRKRECECCRLTTWQNKPIPIELHHIDGCRTNNQIENLQLLCPNCHALTDNYRGKNKIGEPQKRIADEIFIELIPKCFSIRHVLLRAGVSSGAPNYRRIRKLMADKNLKLKQKELSERDKKRMETIIKKYGSLENATRTKIAWPSKENLLEDLKKEPVSSIAKKLGVSDAAIRKWAKKYGIDIFEISPWAKRHGGHNRIKTNQNE